MRNSKSGGVVPYTCEDTVEPVEDMLLNYHGDLVQQCSCCYGTMAQLFGSARAAGCSLEAWLDVVASQRSGMP